MRPFVAEHLDGLGLTKFWLRGAGQLDGWIRDFKIEQAVERGGVVAGVEERTEAPLGFAPDRVLLVDEFPGGFLESLSVGLHGLGE